MNIWENDKRVSEMIDELLNERKKRASGVRVYSLLN